MSDFIDYLRARKEQTKEIMLALICASIFAIYYMFLHLYLSNEWIVSDFITHIELLFVAVIATTFILSPVLYKDYKDFKGGEKKA